VISRLSRQDFPNLVLDIQTNGVLFDQTAWSEMDLAGRVGMVAISVDAVTEQTYNIVRRGGSFQRLHENLRFLATRRMAGEIAYMRLDFVVQTLNFAEMPGMPALADLYGFDRIKFQMIRNWNTYDPAEFALHDIGSKYNARYEEFLDVLRHPSLSSDRVEFWGMEAALEDAKRLKRERLSKSLQSAWLVKLQSRVLDNIRALS
jgi:sulfatase maturation enzyme AslB (radical SAM superfamily)